MGMLSLIDAILDRPLPDILKEIPVASDIKGALLGEGNALGDVYRYVQTYERGDWDELYKQSVKLGLDEATSSELYLNAVKWGHQCFEVDSTGNHS